MQQISRNIKTNQQYMENDQYDKKLKAISRNTYWHESKSKFDKANELKQLNKMFFIIINELFQKVIKQKSLTLILN